MRGPSVFVDDVARRWGTAPPSARRMDGRSWSAAHTGGAVGPIGKDGLDGVRDWGSVAGVRGDETARGEEP